MPKSSKHGKYLQLSDEFPVFIFEEFNFSLEHAGLKAKFHFNLGNRYHFYPELFIPRNNWAFPDEVLNSLLPSLIFNIGMVELISYWKAACPPEVIIRPAGLTQDQVQWWKKLYFFGLGEFFYLNSIEADEKSFMEIKTEAEVFSVLATPDMGAGVIIPVGGGKDSAVTLELLRGSFEIMPLVLNPRGATSAVIEKSGIPGGKTLLITRTIDPLLIELNNKGFLNGHTPFSALLAFISLTAALLTGRKYIALSNESSANEATIPGTKINHQYSKSIEFEDDFREYVNKFITRKIEYFSFLRPLGELQIAWLFSHMPAYHTVFRSCNAGSKTDTWCGKCPKCLFTFIILSPFMGTEALTSVFGRNLLDDPGLLETLLKVTGLADEKPFDCIGTIDEVNLALGATLELMQGKELPRLLKEYSESPSYHGYREHDFRTLLSSWQPNRLPMQFEEVLKNALHD